MKKTSVVTILLSIGSIAYAQDAEIPRAKITNILTTYADSIGCSFSFNPENIVALTGVGPEYVALFYIDIGCGGGSVRSALATISYEFRGQELYVLPEMSGPSAQMYGMPRFVDRIFLSNGDLWFEGRVHEEGDANNFPSKTVLSGFQRIKTNVRIDEEHENTVYFWKSDKDFGNY